MANWDVLRELDNLRQEMAEAFRREAMQRSGSAFLFAPSEARRFPLVNLSEDEGSLYIDVLLPGVDPRDTEVSVMGNTLTISGERKPVVEKKGQVVHRSELGAGRFSRSLELPAEIDAEKISAEYKDGILRATLAKAEHARPKRIAIRVG